MNITGIMLRKNLQRSGLVLGLIGVVSVTLILSGCSGSYYGHWSPAWSPDGTKIAFHSTGRGQGWAIYVINSDGSKQTNLTKNTAGGSNPAWSPDGTKIAYSSCYGEIYAINADGSNQTNLTNNSAHDGDPMWSPDGTKIAFSSDRDGNGDIYVMNNDGSNQTNLTNNSANDDAPAWSPDGTKIAFRNDRSGHGEIYVMNADGSNQMKLTSSEYAANYLAWSPDGNKIAFGRATRSWLWSEIYVVNADGTNLRNLNPRGFGAEGPVTTGLTWSPDGTKIAFAGCRPGLNGMDVEIYVMDSDGSNQTRLTHKSDVGLILSLIGMIVGPPRPNCQDLKDAYYTLTTKLNGTV
ncbi:Tol-Pal system protein TolB [subsurface metagenome]